MKKKLFALLLSFAMLVNMVPPFGTIAMAAEDMSCEHHPVHTAECGYVEAVEAHDCTHVCGEDCQIENLSCAHTHDETCGYVPAVAEIPEVPCNFAHSVELCGENEESCPHAGHDEFCGYAPAVPGTAEVPCGHEHTEACYTTVCSHVHDTACGYAEAVEGSSCGFVCEECIAETRIRENLSTEQLYEAMYQETTLRGLFELVNNNVDALLGFSSEQVYDFEALILELQEKNNPLTEDEEEALEQLLDNVEYLRDLLGEGTCPVCGEEGGKHTDLCTLKDTWRMSGRAIPYADTSESVGTVHSSKTIVQDDADNHAIQIDVYTEGVVSTVPTEIVMIIDQSGSMYQAANGANSYMTYDDFIGENGGDRTKGAQHMGYYVAVAKKRITSDWNGNVDSWRRDYVVALVGYSMELNEWVCTPVLGMEEAQYTSLEVNPTYNRYTELCNNVIPLKDSVFYEQRNSNTKIFKSLYGATIDGFYTFIQEVSGISNTKIAIVPFSTPRGHLGVKPDISIRDQNVGGTGAFINGQFVHVNAITDYAAALNPTYTTQGRAYIEQSMQAILTNYGGTCTEDGFKIANEIFKASENSNNPETTRIVVCFTDGGPTVLSNDNATYINYPNHEPYTAAIEAAYATKNTYGASVYVYGQSSLPSDAQTLLKYLSSDYPQATSFNESGSVTQTGYSDTVGNDSALETIFRELGQKIFEESDALSEESEIRDTVTPYFDIGGDYNSGNIIVQQIPNSGWVDVDGNVIFDETDITTLYDEVNNIAKVTVVINKDVEYDQPLSDGTTATRIGDQVVVSGYDYGKNTVFPREERGAKLRLLIPIEPNPDFIGGNWSATNSPDSGLFPDNNPESPPVGGEGTGDGGYFPPPHEDVEVKEDEVIEADVEARAGATYLEEIPYSELLELVELRIKDKDENPSKDVVLNMGKENYGVEPWRTDYVFIEVHLYDTKVDADGNLLDADGNLLEEGKDPVKDPNKELTPEQALAIRRDHAVIAEVYIWSRYTYDKETGEPILQEDRPADLQPAVGTIYLSVYYPTFVFNDVTLYHGQPLSLATEAWGEEMEATPYLQWYTNEEYEDLLANPQPRTESPGYVPLPEGSWGKNAEVVVQETPEVYFKVNPIDATLQGNHTGAVDDHFYDKFGTYMGKEQVDMNVRVFYRNDGDTGSYDPDNPTGTADAMRNAFFLHVLGPKGQDVGIPKHTSGSQNNDDMYWGAEFRVIPAYCQLTIEKVGGLPNETYIFTVARGQTNEYSLVTGEQIQSETEPVYYTTVSVTTDANGYGSVTLTELPVGVYTVTEDMAWSWRFKDSKPTYSWKYENGTPGTGTKIYLLGNANEDTATVTVTNSSPTDHWLSGMSAVVENIFGKKKQ